MSSSVPVIHDTSYTEWMTCHVPSEEYMTRHLPAKEIDMTTTTATTADLAQLTGSYTIDPTHTQIGFVARHAMVTKVRGAFDDFAGTVVFDAADPAATAVTVTIEATSINTRNVQRDEHLRGNDFFAMEQYPQITFVSTGLRLTDATSFELTGDLSIK